MRIFFLFFHITRFFFKLKEAKLEVEMLDKKVSNLWKNPVKRMMIHVLSLQVKTNTAQTINQSIFSCKLYALTVTICNLC